MLARQTADGRAASPVWVDLTDPAGRGRRELVPRVRAARVGLAPGRVRRRARCSRASARQARSPRSRGSPATRCAPPRAGRGWPTACSTRHSTSSPRGRGHGPLEASRRRPDADRPADDRRSGSSAPRARWTTPRPRSPAIALHARVAISGACRCCSTRPRAPADRTRSRTGGDLDRARRDLELFLLQHRLDPPLAARRARGARAERRGCAMRRAEFEQRYQARSRSVGIPLERLRAREVRRDARGLRPRTVRRGARARRLDRRLQRAARAPLRAADDDRLLPDGGRAPPAGELAGATRTCEAILGEIPAAIPDGRYDLVVASEILYYLAAAALDRTLARLESSMIAGRSRWSPSTGGPPGPERPLDADQVHTTPASAAVAGDGQRPPAPTTTCSTSWSAYERRVRPADRRRRPRRAVGGAGPSGRRGRGTGRRSSPTSTGCRTTARR